MCSRLGSTSLHRGQQNSITIDFGYGSGGYLQLTEVALGEAVRMNESRSTLRRIDERI